MARSPRYGRSRTLIIEGLVAAGVLTFFGPGITALALVFFIATWAVVTGVFEIAAAIQLRRVLTGEWLLMVSGIPSIVFAGLVFAFPAAGALGIAWVLGAYAATTRVILVVLGIRLRSHAIIVA